LEYWAIRPAPKNSFSFLHLSPINQRREQFAKHVKGCSKPISAKICAAFEVVQAVAASVQSPRKQFMSQAPAASFIIVGLTRSGKKFRPSDWAERLCGVMSAFGAEKRMKYSPYVSPCTFDGEKSVLIDSHLNDLEPMAYKFMLNFANDNDLQIVEQEAAFCEIGEDGKVNCKPA
jgi:hypothetical protein